MEALLALDGNLLLAIQGLRQPWLDPVVAWFTQLGNVGIAWIVLSLAMLCWRPTRKAGTLGLLALALGALCTNVVLKHLVARPRPWLSLPLTPLVAEHDPNSFPSGHTCAAFAAVWPGPGRCPGRGGCWPRRRRCVWACPGCMRGYTTPPMCWQGRSSVSCAPGRRVRYTRPVSIR